VNCVVVAESNLIHPIEHTLEAPIPRFYKLVYLLRQSTTYLIKIVNGFIPEIFTVKVSPSGNL